jgi:hypothetical protein
MAVFRQKEKEIRKKGEEWKKERKGEKRQRITDWEEGLWEVKEISGKGKGLINVGLTERDIGSTWIMPGEWIEKGRTGMVMTGEVIPLQPEGNEWAVWFATKKQWWGPTTEPRAKTLEELYRLNGQSNASDPFHMVMSWRNQELRFTLRSIPKKGEELIANYRWKIPRGTEIVEAKRKREDGDECRKRQRKEQIIEPEKVCQGEEKCKEKRKRKESTEQIEGEGKQIRGVKQHQKKQKWEERERTGPSGATPPAGGGAG